MRSWKFSKSLSFLMFFRKGSSVFIPGFDPSLSRDAYSTVSRLKWGTLTVLSMNLCGLGCDAHAHRLHGKITFLFFLGQILKTQVLLATSVFVFQALLRKRSWSCRNETFKLPKISSNTWFCSFGEAIIPFCDVSFCLRMSLAEEWNNKQTTDRTGIARSLFAIR